VNKESRLQTYYEVKKFDSNGNGRFAGPYLCLLLFNLPYEVKLSAYHVEVWHSEFSVPSNISQHAISRYQ